MPSRKPNIKARNHNLQLKELQDTFENNAMDVYSNAKRHKIPKALSILCFYRKMWPYEPKWGIKTSWIDKPAWFAVSPEKTIVPKSCQEKKTFVTWMLYCGLQIEQFELIWNSKTTFWLLKIALYYWQCCFMKLSYMDEKQELRIRKNVQLKGVFYWNG